MSWKSQERRKFIRVRFPCKIIIYTPQEHFISTHTENISVGGVRVIIEEELKKNIIVDLEIEINDKLLLCKGEVVWEEKKESRCCPGVFYYDMGIEFKEIKPKDKEIIRNIVESTD
jgi:c-di-GMP-binding flagellar brake protein YcgR